MGKAEYGVSRKVVHGREWKVACIRYAQPEFLYDGATCDLRLRGNSMNVLSNVIPTQSATPFIRMEDERWAGVKEETDDLTDLEHRGWETQSNEHSESPTSRPLHSDGDSASISRIEIKWYWSDIHSGSLISHREYCTVFGWGWWGYEIMNEVPYASRNGESWIILGAMEDLELIGNCDHWEGKYQTVSEGVTGYHGTVTSLFKISGIHRVRSNSVLTVQLMSLLPKVKRVSGGP
jgi:hypothetical protein